MIGWLYQFYISEKKDEVFAALKKNKKITPENIPAATQLFTPHWIVRYLVENSLGRLWMLNRPKSKLIDRMDYYIPPVDSGEYEVDSRSVSTHYPLPTSYLKISSPEDLKICDPACGSGHMLVYAFDLLYAIYEEEGYEPSEIPGKILSQNLYGIEIDERAGELAAFALTMKAREKQRRFFRKPVQPQICVLENIQFDEGELKDYMDFIGRDLFTAPLLETLHQFREADNFGSLIRPRATDVKDMLTLLEKKDIAGQLLLYQTHQKVIKALDQADYLSQKYHVVVANPPYMSSKGMNASLSNWLKTNYSDTRSDLFSASVLRYLELLRNGGFSGFMTPFVWMFLSSCEKLRSHILDKFTLISLVKPSYTPFFESAIVAVCAFVINNDYRPDYKGSFFDLDYLGTAEEQAPRFKQRKKDKQYYRASSADFRKIPGSPIAYWVSEGMREVFEIGCPLHEVAIPRAGMITGNNEMFVRLAHEVSHAKIGFRCKSRTEAKESQKKWFPYQKGGPYRKYFGNLEYIVDWENDGHRVRTTTNDKGKVPAHAFNESYIFNPNVNWSAVTSSKFSCRITEQGCLFDASGSAAFPPTLEDCYILAAFLNSYVARELIRAINPTLNFQAWEIGSLPILTFEKSTRDRIAAASQRAYTLSQLDWNMSETSWDFNGSPILCRDYLTSTLYDTYQLLRQGWDKNTSEMHSVETENNRAIINSYALEGEIDPNIPLNEIALNCNPHYRYGGDKTEEELEALLLADTMKEFISYSVGCMFGRYSLDKPGLILANQGETLEDYLRKVCSGEWEVGSEDPKLSTTHYPLSTQTSTQRNPNGDRTQLQRTDRLAESDGSSRTSLSSNEAVSQRGTLWSDESDQTFSSIHSIQHSGRSGQEIDSRVSEVLVNCERFKSRDGNPNPACPALELCNERHCAANSEPIGGSKPSTERTHEQPKITTHCPLSTIHFLPDTDNVIPILDTDWFPDDITDRFRKFLRVTFGDDHYDENLKFLEKAIGKDIRKYFLKDFYPDHIKRYKKRPIYWLFSSPKGTFNALIYMHRYRPDTVSIVLNDYLREFRTKLTARKANLEQTSISGSASASEKTKALKEIESLKKMIQELEDYERDILYPLATEQVEIDLDDGVKVNYNKFGAALKKIPGLEVKEN